MMHYRKKSDAVEAYQWVDRDTQHPEWIADALKKAAGTPGAMSFNATIEKWEVYTPDVSVRVDVGDWIIRYPDKTCLGVILSHLFEEHYELAYTKTNRFSLDDRSCGYKPHNKALADLITASQIVVVALDITDKKSASAFLAKAVEKARETNKSTVVDFSKHPIGTPLASLAERDPANPDSVIQVFVERHLITELVETARSVALVRGPKPGDDIVRLYKAVKAYDKGAAS